MPEAMLSTVFSPAEFLSVSANDQLPDDADGITNSSLDFFASSPYIENTTELLPPDVLRYLCESNDAVLNLSTVEFFANFTLEEDGWPTINWSTAVRIVFIGLLFVSSIIGNTIVVVVVFWSPNLKTSLNFYLVNLAIADLFITCICIWNHLVKNIFYNYPLGPIMCRIGSFVQASCLLGSVLTLSTLSLERVYAVLCPLRARHRHVPPLWKLAAVWMVSITAAAPLCALNEHREYEASCFPRFKERRCTYHHSPGAFNPTDGRCVRDTHTFIYVYHVLVTILMFFLPLLVMLCAYLLIVQRLWMLQSLGESPEVANSAHLSTKKKVVRLSCSVLLCFVACWAPLQSTILYAITAKPQSLSSPEFESTIFWVYMLAYSNSALNPILYAWFSKIFREEFRMMIGTRERRYHSSVTCRSCTRPDPPSKTSLALQSLSYSNSLRETRRFSQGDRNRVMIRYGSAYVPRTRRHYGGPTPLICERAVIQKQDFNVFPDDTSLRMEKPIIENNCPQTVPSTPIAWKEQSQRPFSRIDESAAQAPATEDTSEIMGRFENIPEMRAKCNSDLSSLAPIAVKANAVGEKDILPPT
ncbi:G protein-coupled receptor rhodopsin-like [Trinorchestia longiramus]|nr:G protein-coupled receptor rhodopsin-like [Trinorchestia longiramus]